MDYISHDFENLASFVHLSLHFHSYQRRFELDS